MTNPSSHNATVDGKHLNVSIISSGVKVTYLGYFDLLNLNVAPGKNMFTKRIFISVSNEDTLKELGRLFLSEKQLKMRISGNVKVTVTDLFTPAETTVELEKDITFPGLNGLKDLTIDALRLINVTKDFFTYELNVSVYNPSKLEIDIASMSWNVTYNNSIVGTVESNNVKLSPGWNKLTATGTLQVWNYSDGIDLASRYISGENVSVVLKGKVELEIGSASVFYLSEVQLPVTLTGQPNISVSLNNLMIYAIGQTYMDVNLNVTIHNPSQITGVLKNVTLDVLYENQLLGNVSISQVPLVYGDNKVSMNATFKPTNTTALADLASNYLAGKTVTIVVRGSKSGNTLSSLLHGWTQEVQITSQKTFSFNVTQIGLLNSTANSMFLHFEFQVNNPTNAVITATNLTFKVMLKDTGEYVGNVTIATLTLYPGINNISTDGKLVAHNASLISEIIDKYLNNEDTEFTLVSISDKTTIIGSLISSVKFNVTMHGVSPLDIVIISMQITNVTSTNVTVAVEVSITNPTSSTVSVGNITFITEYDNNFLGNITLNPMTVEPGTHTYNLNVTFAPSNTTLLKELISAYINGEDIKLTVRGSANGTDVLSTILQKYINVIQLPPFNLQLQVMNFDIIGSTENTLEIGMNVSLNNPLLTYINLWNLTFNVYYNGQYIGNFTLDTLNLAPQSSVISINGTLDASANRTNIGEFLSLYMTGNDIPLEVQGTFYTNMSGLIDNSQLEITLEYTLPETGESIIQSVNLVSVTFNVYATSSLTGITVHTEIVANATATLNNPTNFSVNVTSLYYDIYYDDPDGARGTISGIFTYSYSPAYNIYVTTINKTLTTTPIEMPPDNSTTISEQITLTDMELVLRMYTDYQNEKLYVNILNGLMTLQIGVFTVQVPFEFTQVHVS